MQISTYIGWVKVFFTKKRIIWTILAALILLGGWFLFFRKSAGGNLQTAIVKVQNIEKTVLTTGQVVSSTDLDLSFQTTGVVKKLYVKEGDRVYAGQTLATLDQENTLASIQSSQGNLAESKAGVASAQTALDNAKEDLKDQLSNKAFNSANTVVLSDTNILFSNPQSNNPQFSISNTVQTDSQLVNNVNTERVAINTILSKWQKEIVNFSESNTDVVTANALKNLTTISNYFSDIISLLSTYTQTTTGGSQTTINGYITNLVAGKSTVDSAYTSIVSDAQAVKSAQSSLEQANASVLSAQGTVRVSQVGLGNTVITAPASGTITQIDIKLGEQATAGKEVMKLLNTGELHSEANVSEADIASVTPGQTIDNTFDALGPDKHFTSKVLTVNPASIVISGVVDYKVTGSLENIPQVKPGMTVNMTILVSEKKDVLVAPSSSIINKDGKKLIKVIDDPKKKTYHEVEVQTGIEADGGITEIVSGLTSGQEVVTYIK